MRLKDEVETTPARITNMKKGSKDCTPYANSEFLYKHCNVRQVSSEDT